jgi:hypothetical protein
MNDINDLEYIFTCTKCKIPKKNKEFYSNKTNKSKRKFNSHCKECYKLRDRTHNNSFISHQKMRNERPLASLYYSSRSNTKRSGKDFNITIEYLNELLLIQENKCYYTGRPLNMILGNPDSVSIDRKNPELGYIKENIVLCQWKVNRMKNDATIEELLSFCKDIIRNLGK